MTVRKNVKAVYSKPMSESVCVDDIVLMDASGDGPITELPSTEVPLYPDGEGKDPAEALSKGGHNLWNDCWDDDDEW